MDIDLLEVPARSTLGSTGPAASQDYVAGSNFNFPNPGKGDQFSSVPPPAPAPDTGGYSPFANLRSGR